MGEGEQDGKGWMGTYREGVGLRWRGGGWDRDRERVQVGKEEGGRSGE